VVVVVSEEPSESVDTFLLQVAVAVVLVDVDNCEELALRLLKCACSS
jgi:hypothetical protein